MVKSIVPPHFSLVKSSLSFASLANRRQTRSDHESLVTSRSMNQEEVSVIAVIKNEPNQQSEHRTETISNVAVQTCEIASLAEIAEGIMIVENKVH